MKKLLTLFFVLAIAAVSLPADPVEGYWISVDDKTDKVTAGWHIYEAAGVLYGRIASIAGFPQDSPAVLCKASYPGFPLPGRVNEMPVVGTPWIFGLHRDREGQWSGGKIVDPNNGNIYACRIIFHPAGERRYREDTLEMRGSIGPIGRSQYWRKSDEAAASGLR
jgi:uncharacterized protein (DUF2147 family)